MFFNKLCMSFMLFLCPLVYSQTFIEINSPNPAENGFFSTALDQIDDINNDGYPDILVGAAGEKVGIFSSSGRAYIFSGLDQSLLKSMESLFPESNGIFGADIGAIGDWDNDGLSEILVGVPFENGGGEPEGGRAYVFSEPFGGPIHLFFPDSAVEDGNFGISIDTGYDLNGDGFNEVLIGARGEGNRNPLRPGRAYVFNGMTRSLLHRIAPSDSSEIISNFGGSVSFIKDLNGDQVADILIGARFSNVESIESAGKAFLYSGLDGALIHTFKPNMPQQFGWFGRRVENVGDMNNDGFDDIGISSREVGQQFSSTGVIYVFSGANFDTLHTILAPSSDPAVEIGSAFIGIGDYNIDGFDDILVGQFNAPVNGIDFAGKVHIFSGQSGQYIQSFQSPSPEEDGFFGANVSVFDDLNDDSIPELLIATAETTSGVHRSGKLYMILSGSTSSIDNEGNAALVQTFILKQNYPNPFNPSTTIPVELSKAMEIRLDIYDINGRLINNIASGIFNAGEYEFTWDGRDEDNETVASGIYFLKLSSGAFSTAKKIMLIR